MRTTNEKLDEVAKAVFFCADSNGDLDVTMARTILILLVSEETWRLRSVLGEAIENIPVISRLPHKEVEQFLSHLLHEYDEVARGWTLPTLASPGLYFAVARLLLELELTRENPSRSALHRESLIKEIKKQFKEQGGWDEKAYRAYLAQFDPEQKEIDAQYDRKELSRRLKYGVKH